MIAASGRASRGARIGIAAGALALALAACRSTGPAAPQPATADPVTPAAGVLGRTIAVSARSVLDAPTTVERVELRQSLLLRADDADFGGYSGMALIAGGTALLAVSDHGTWLHLGLEHAADGRLIGVREARIAPLLDPHGRPVEGRMARDAESLTPAPGGFIVGFEGEHRLWRFRGTDASVLGAHAEPVRAPRAIRRADDNSGFEAVTALPGGQLVIFAEELFDRRGRLRGWIGHGGRWRRLRLEARGAFRPTSLVGLPDGSAILVERSYSPAEGVRVRIARLTAEMLRPGRTIAPESLASLDSSLPIDNLEAADAVAGDDGSVTLYLLSDDNFSQDQRTLLLQLRLPAPGGAP